MPKKLTDEDKITGTLWLLVFFFNATQVVLVGWWWFVFPAIIDLALAEAHWHIVWSILEYIHTEIHFYRMAKVRRQRYNDFKGRVKGLDNDAFEAEARELVR